MSQSVPTVPTVGEIARRIGKPVHRIEYVIRSRGIQPSGRAGNARVFTDADVERIASELRRIDAEKGQAALLRRIAEGQEKLLAAIQDGEGSGGGTDPESRMRLRSIDVQLLRILEEMSAGRQETLTDLKTDIAQLTAAIRQLGRSAGRA